MTKPSTRPTRPGAPFFDPDVECSDYVGQSGELSRASRLSRAYEADSSRVRGPGIRVSEFGDLGERSSRPSRSGHGQGSGVEIICESAQSSRFRDGKVTGSAVLRGPRRGPQSRGAGGVGDVAGERRTHTAINDAFNRPIATGMLAVALDRDDDVELPRRGAIEGGGYHGFTRAYAAGGRPLAASPTHRSRCGSARPRRRAVVSSVATAGAGSELPRRIGDLACLTLRDGKSYGA